MTLTEENIQRLEEEEKAKQEEREKEKEKEKEKVSTPKVTKSNLDVPGNKPVPMASPETRRRAEMIKVEVSLRTRECHFSSYKSRLWPHI